jgi:hypothetical protein
MLHQQLQRCKDNRNDVITGLCFLLTRCRWGTAAVPHRRQHSCPPESTVSSGLHEMTLPLVMASDTRL